jgi:hypothetical protein
MKYGEDRFIWPVKYAKSILCRDTLHMSIYVVYIYMVDAKFPSNNEDGAIDSVWAPVIMQSCSRPRTPAMI